MIRGIQGAAAGGQIPRCFGFRLRPRLISGKAPGTGPWPVIVREIGPRHQGDLLVFDASWYRCSAKGDDGEPVLGPWVVDPASANPSWAYDVTYADELGEDVVPAADGATSGLAGALHVAQRTVVVYDSGTVANGAAISSGVLDLSPYRELTYIVNNAGAVARQLSLQYLLDDGVTSVYSAYPLVNAAPGSVPIGVVGFGATSANITHAVTASPPTKGVIALAAGGAANGRVTVYGR